MSQHLNEIICTCYMASIQQIVAMYSHGFSPLMCLGLHVKRTVWKFSEVKTQPGQGRFSQPPAET
jgi:hypothetical protein